MKKGQPKGLVALPDSEDKTELKRSFDKLTELSSTLMDAGELDIYSIPREVKTLHKLTSSQHCAFTVCKKGTWLHVVVPKLYG